MTDISISFIQFLIIGIPQGFLSVLAVYIFTRTKIDFKKYIILSFVISVIGYLVRFLPITLGVNSMLSFFALILAFLLIYKPDLPHIINLIISVIVIFMLIGFSEIINEIILVLAFGKSGTLDLLNSGSEIISSLSMIPTNIIFVILILVSYVVLQKIKDKKEKNGKSSKKISQ